MKRKVYVADEHEIDPSLIDRDALKVIDQLRNAGFDAYLVGGSVRDLLTKKKPKDFDISTSARPEEVKEVFRRQCILIGKRFRLAHIRFGNKIFEVATFRSGEQEEDLIVRDNEWGTEEEDVVRRDFTINGLLYDPHEHFVIDYTGGWEDIHKGLLRTIGDPATRFKQDPVRMIRLLKFRARFGFEIEEETKKALLACREEITKSSQARVLEELFRMLESTASSPFIHLMMQSGLLSILMPVLTSFLESPFGKSVFQYLELADKINEKRPRPLSRPLLGACLLFPILSKHLQTEYVDKGLSPHIGEITQLAQQVVREVMTQAFNHFPKRTSSSIASILSMQYRLTPLSGKLHYHHKLFHLKGFPEALEFFKIRALINPDLFDHYQRWKKIFQQHDNQGQHRKSPPPPNRAPVKRRQKKD